LKIESFLYWELLVQWNFYLFFWLSLSMLLPFNFLLLFLFLIFSYIISFPLAFTSSVFAFQLSFTAFTLFVFDVFVFIPVISAFTFAPSF